MTIKNRHFQCSYSVISLDSVLRISIGDIICALPIISVILFLGNVVAEK